MGQKLAPHSNEAEMSVIGAVLLENDSYHKLDLQPDDFYVAWHRFIFSSLKKLIDSGTGADLVTLSDELRQRGHLEKCGGSTYLAELVDYVPTAANITYYANIVNTKSKSRQVMSAAKTILVDAEQSSDPDVLISTAFDQLQRIGQSSGGKVWMSLADQAREYEQYIQTADDTRFSTGYPELDCIIRGVAPGEVMMISGYSGTFKSAFMHNILLNSAMRGSGTRKKSLFFSLEMPSTLVYQRSVQITLEQDPYYIESGYAGKKAQQNYRETTMKKLERLGVDNLIVNPRPALTIEQVEHYTRLARAEYGEIGVIGIDYLGLMAADGARSEYERISYCAEQSKNMAKRLNLPVVILTQVSREAIKSGKIEMHSAKGSGAVEASADYMLSISRNTQKEIIIELLKNRNGRADLKFRADLEAKYLRFRSLEPYDDAARKSVDRGLTRMGAVQHKAEANPDPF
ncbi:MAG: replicative DNA helicase [Desulfuromusa sp.]